MLRDTIRPLIAVSLLLLWACGALAQYPLAPLICPSGYYCPTNTGLPTLTPCPIGTYSNVTGLTAVNQCLPCPPGMYCATSAARQPTGLCSAGYYCTSRASNIAPSDGVTGNICPKGYYCPLGTSTPMSCPPGTYNSLTGMSSLAAGCLPCSPGYYCPYANSTTDRTALCAAGYVCKSGSSSATPVDGITGYPCPRGAYCPSGSGVEIGCPPGKYAAALAQINCDPCDAGRMCPSGNMSASLPCQLGYYCPSGSVTGTPCPAGTFNNITGLSLSSQCTPCLTGFYCPTVGIVYPMLPCSAGSWCYSGVSIPNPSTPNAYPSNGLCPVGHYCVAGATAPARCPAGTFSNSEGLGSSAQCTPCTAGKACTTTGLTGPNADCAAGYYCPSGSSVTNPASFACFTGSYCPTGSAYPVPCAGGWYQMLPGRPLCDVCPVGYYCPSNSSNAIICPANYYCPSGSGSPTICPAGTFSNVTGLQAATDCYACPAGKYCTNGLVSGDCAAGYICYYGNYRADPPWLAGSDSRGGYCPKGHYCLAGTPTPTQCSGATVNAFEGGATPAACGPCPAGFICVPGNPVPTLCPAGKYCEFNMAAANCPNGTFNNVTGATNATMCLACPAGYYCPSTGMATFDNFPCPAGKYCPPGSTAPQPCPGGTYRGAMFGGALVDACLSCPAGFYCLSNGTVTPVPCRGGFYCPVGSMQEIDCPGGHYCSAAVGAPVLCNDGSYCPNATEYRIACPPSYYCPSGAIAPVNCPAGYFCPSMSIAPQDCLTSHYCPAGAVAATPCPVGHFCPPHASLPVMCPAGTALGNSTSNRTAVDNCGTCPPGTYGAAPDRSECLTCPAGYICSGGTTQQFPTDESTHKGRLCKEGRYCPAGSFKEVECPAGTFQPSTGKGSLSDCTPCPAGSYNPSTGQARCLVCGASSYSLGGAVACRCNGTHRSFQEFDGNCICEPRYVFYTEELTVSEEDSSIDCQPIVYDRCTTDQGRSLLGKCVASSYSCASECVSAKGRFNVNTGTCECSEIQDEDTVCDEECRNKQRAMYFDQTVKMMVLNDPSSGTKKYFNTTSLSGIVQCRATGIDSSCNFYVTHMSERGFRGVYNGGDSYLSSVLYGKRNSTSAAMMSVAAFSSSRYVHTLDDSSSLPSGIDQPVTCLRKGEGMLWAISSDRVHYPVYLKDSLFNTNADFDYGSFRQLANQLKDPQTTIASFAFTFNEAGVYTFADAASSSRLQIISVVGDNQDCPKGSARFSAMTSSSLVSVGVRRSDDILLEPDWLLISILLLGLVILIAGLIGGLYYFRSKSWGRDLLDDPQYRVDALGHDFDRYASKGSATAKLPKYRIAPTSPKDRDVEVQEAAFTSAMPATPGASVKGGDMHWNSGNAGKDGAAYDLDAFADDFWDFERQIDLEAFDAKRVYQTLDRHALEVQNRLESTTGNQAEVCERILEETESIKALLGARLGRSRGSKLRGIDGSKKSILPDGAQVVKEEDILTVDAMQSMIEDEMAAREVFVRRQKAVCEDWDQVLERLKAARANGSSPEKVAELAAQLKDVTGQLRTQADKERQRRLDVEDRLRDCVGDEAVNCLVALDGSRREAEERTLRNCEQMSLASSNVAGRLNDMETAYKKARKRAEARGDVESVQRLDKEHSYDVAAVGRELDETLTPFVRPEIADHAGDVLSAFHSEVRSNVPSLLSAERDARLKAASQTYDLPPEFTSAMSAFMAKTLHEMGLLSDIQAARVVAGDREGTVLDPDLLKQVLEAKQQGRPILIGSTDSTDSKDANFTAEELQKRVQDEIKRLLADGHLDAQKFSDALSEQQRRQLDELERKLALRRAALQDRQAKERSAVEDQSVQEERIETKALDEILLADAKVSRDALDKRLQERLQSAGNEAEKQRIMADYQRESDVLESNLASEARRQREKLAARLQEQRRTRLERLRADHVAEAAVEEECARLSRTHALEVPEGPDGKSGNVMSEEAMLNKILQTRHNHLVSKHEHESRDLEQVLAEEEASQRQVLDDKVGSLLAAQTEALRVVAEQQMRGASESEKRRIMDNFERDIAELEDSLLSEKARQAAELEKRLIAKRTRAKEVMLKKHAVERESEIEEAEEAVERLVNSSATAGSTSESEQPRSIALDWESQKAMLEADHVSKALMLKDAAESERQRLQDEVAREESAGLRAIDEKIADSYEQQRLELEERMASELQRRGAHTDAEKKRLMDTFTTELAALEDSLEAERARQRRDLQEAVAKKKEARERSLKVKQMQEERRQLEEEERKMQNVRLAAVKTPATEIVDDHRAGGSSVVPLEPVIPVLSTEQERALERQHARILTEMEAQQTADRNRMMAEIELEVQKEAEREAKRLEETKRRMLAEEKAKLAAQAEQDLASAKDENEAAMIMQAHQKEMEKLIGSVEDEKSRQIEETRRRLEERKRKKAADLIAKQEAERRREALQQTKEILEIKSKNAVAAERQALMQAIESGQVSKERIEEAIEVTMQQRHVREAQQLAEQQQGDRKALLEALLEARKLLPSSVVDEMPPIEQDERVVEMDVLQARARLEMRQRQLDEIASACSELSPQEAMLKAQGLEAAKRSSELRALQLKLQEEREQSRRKLEEERREMELAQQQAIERELQEMQAKFAAEQQKMEDELAAVHVQKQKKLEEMRAEREAAMAAELKEANRDDLKNEIMQRYADEQVELERAVDGEKVRQEKALRERLRKKQEEKLRQKKAAMEAELEQRRREEEEQQIAAREAERLAREREEVRRRVEEEEARRREAERVEAEKREEERQRLIEAERLQKELEEQRLQEEESKRMKEETFKVEQEKQIREKEAREKEALEKEALEKEAREKQRLDQIARQAEMQAQPLVHASSIRHHPSTGQQSTVVSLSHANMPSEEDWFKSLAASPLFQKLSSVDDRLSAIHEEVVQQHSKRKAAASSLEEIAISLRNRQISPSGNWMDDIDQKIASKLDASLEIVEASSLSEREAAAYAFAVEVCEQSLQASGKPQVLIAAHLPLNKCAESNASSVNPLAHSYLWTDDGRALMIHRDRLQDAGDFSSVLMHALSLKTASMSGTPFGSLYKRAVQLASARAFRLHSDRQSAAKVLVQAHEQKQSPSAVSDEDVQRGLSQYGGGMSESVTSEYLQFLQPAGSSESESEKDETDALQGSVDLLAQLTIKIRTLERRIRECTAQEADLRMQEAELQKASSDDDEKLLSDLRKVSTEKLHVIQRLAMYNKEIASAKERKREIDGMSVAERRMRNTQFFHELLASGPGGTVSALNTPRGSHS